MGEGEGGGDLGDFFTASGGRGGIFLPLPRDGIRGWPSGLGQLVVNAL